MNGLSLKIGASVRGLRPEILFALQVASSVYRDLDVPLVVTEGTGGKHKEGSLHYVGLAADLRTNDLPTAKLPDVVQSLKNRLGTEYDVVVETDHIHIEYQPKEAL